MEEVEIVSIHTFSGTCRVLLSLLTLREKRTVLITFSYCAEYPSSFHRVRFPFHLR